MASRHACLAPDLKGSFSFSPLSIMLAVGFSYMVLFCWGKFLLYLICTEVFFFFYHKRVLNFVKSFSASIEMIMWLLSLILLMQHYHIINLHMWSHPWIPVINPTWSWLVCDPFTVLLSTVCSYFVEDFCIYVHQSFPFSAQTPFTNEVFLDHHS